MRDIPTVLDLVGKTPIVRLPAVQPRGGARLLAKLEYLNPGGSIKDRIALPMIEAAEREGLLGPGGTIVEPTSGNTGVGLAIAAARRGLPVHLRDARQDGAREDLAPARLRGRGRHLPHQCGARRPPRATTRSRGG